MPNIPQDDILNARDRILKAAEESFLNQGYEAVSIRQLTDAADVNVASVNYHFGGKRELYLEVLRKNFAAVADEKRGILQQAIKEQGVPDLRKLVEAYVSLHLGSLEAACKSRRFLQLLARELAEDTTALEMLLQEIVMPIHKLMKDAIGAARPQLSDEKISLCISSMTGQIFHFVRYPEIILRLAGQADENALEQLTQHIIDFSLNGFGDDSDDFIP